jgi:hypothetical protein
MTKKVVSVFVRFRAPKVQPMRDVNNGWLIDIGNFNVLLLFIPFTF